MTRDFVRNFIVHTIANVTGEDIQDVEAAGDIEVDSRDWEQIFGRIEATLDLTSGEMLALDRVIRIEPLSIELHRRLVGAQDSER